MAQIRDLVDIALLVCGSLTFLSISNKLCNLPESHDRCPQSAAVSQRANLNRAIAASETLLTVGIKKAKFYVGYYPYLWENLLAEYTPKRRAVLLFALDAFITSSCYLPTRLTRKLLAWKSHNMDRGRRSFTAFIKDMMWDTCLNILLVTGIGAVVVAISDGYGEDKERFAAICFTSRIFGGVLVYILSHHFPQSSPELHQGSSQIRHAYVPVAAYTMQSALFSEVTNMAAHSDYPGQTNFVQFHQSRAVAFKPKTSQQCAVCNHHPPHLTASGFQISGGLAVIRLVFKGYLDYLSYGNEGVIEFFDFQEQVPHPVIPMFLTRYFFGSTIDTVFDIIERLLQILVWKIERQCCPSPRHDTTRVQLSSWS